MYVFIEKTSAKNKKMNLSLFVQIYRHIYNILNDFYVDSRVYKEIFF